MKLPRLNCFLPYMRFAFIYVLASYGLLAQGQSPQSLAEVKAIFTDSLGQSDWSALIRDKIINRLATSDRFQVVLEPDKADAVMTGFGDISEHDATVVVRFVNNDQRILWTDETKNSRFAKSSSSSVADHIVKDPLEATAPKKQKKRSYPRCSSDADIEWTTRCTVAR